ncbi:hypothetical protein O9929_00740 [Vibrio lentus]|nr:hypothetical protein [Vibrio lentus]
MSLSVPPVIKQVDTAEYNPTECVVRTNIDGAENVIAQLLRVVKDVLHYLRIKFIRLIYIWCNYKV